MAEWLFLFRASALFFGMVISLHCKGGLCREDRARPKEELHSQSIPVSAMSQCAGPQFCDDSTPGTGHERGVFPHLTDGIVAVEQCYSYCFSKLASPLADFNMEPFPEVYNLEGSCSEAYVCYLTCSLTQASSSLLRNITGLSQSASCSDLCTAENGICDRAFPNTLECAKHCKQETCSNLCTELTSYSGIPPPPGLGEPYNVSTPFDLSYAEEFDLARQGVLVLAFPGIQPNGMAYGIIWKVQYNEERNRVETYIPQHLPFHLLPMEVGPLYRVGSNMLSIRQLQCLPGVNLSYALVNVMGVSEFSESQEQCFYGNAFPQPPSEIHVRFGFVEEMAEFELEVWVDQPSVDDDLVSDYGLQVFEHVSSGDISLNNETLFPNKNDLHLTISGTSNVERFLPKYYKHTTYLFGVFALPQGKESVSGRTVYPASNWVQVSTGFPEHPLLNGTECYTVQRDHVSGLANVTTQFKVHTGWKSLVTAATIEGSLSISKVVQIGFPPFVPLRDIDQIQQSYKPDLKPVEPTQSVYTFNYNDVRPSFGEEFFVFKKSFTGRFENVLFPQIAGSNLKFSVLPLPASPVIKLKLCYTFIRTNQSSVLTAEVQWEEPLWPEGKVIEYEVIVNSSVGMQLLSEDVVKLKHSFELFWGDNWQEQPISVWVRAMSRVEVDPAHPLTAGEWAMVSLPHIGQSQFVNTNLQCISSSQVSQESPKEYEEEVESDFYGVLAHITVADKTTVNELKLTTSLYSQCHPKTYCKGTAKNGTGHELYHNLTSLIVDAERCYSFCFKNLSSFFEQDRFLDIYATGEGQLCVSEPWTAAFVCLSVCLSASTEDFTRSCTEQCISSDICQRSLGRNVENTSCLNSCQTVLCPHMCLILEEDFAPTISVENVHRLNMTLGNFSLDYVKDINLRAEGLLEATIDNSVPSSAGPFGVIWKASQGDGEDFYFSQHLPFHLLPMEVGPLYRVGSNMLSIRQLQCLQGVNLSYALVNVMGVSEFSESQEQCFYGSWYPRPPSDFHVIFDYISPMDTDLSLHIWANEISPDQQYVAEYKLNVFGGTKGQQSKCFRKQSTDNPPKLASNATFEDKNNLSFTVHGMQQLRDFLDLHADSVNTGCVYIFQVFAVSLGNVTVPPNPPRIEIKITLMFPPFPEGKDITLKSVDVVDRDHSSGLATLQGHLYIPLSVVVAISSIHPRACLKEKVDGEEVQAMITPYILKGFSPMVNQSDYYINTPELTPTKELQHYDFHVQFIFTYEDIKKLAQIQQSTDVKSIEIPALKPSPVRNLTVISKVDYDQNVFLVNIYWIGPSQPEGKIVQFEITFSSRLVQELYHETVYLSEEESINIMDLTFDHFAEFHLVEEEFINVTVIAVSEFETGMPAVAEFVGIPIPPVSTTPPSGASIYYTIILIFLVPLFLISMVTVFMGIFWYYRKNQQVIIKNDNMVPVTSWLQREEGARDGGFDHPLLVDDWELCPDHIFMQCCIGEGNFGEVYRGALLRPQAAEEGEEEEEQVPRTVAIKVLRSGAPGQLKSDFLKEISTVKKIAMGGCPYVINMVGCCTLQEPLALVLEFLPHGDLLDYLRKYRKQNYLRILAGNAASTKPGANGSVDHSTGDEQYSGLPKLTGKSSSSCVGKKDKELNSADLVSFAHQIASGMEFLSELGIVHRDLACRNVLVGENKVLKISDFGLARENDIYIKTTDGKLPLRWMAIESIAERLYTTKSDVWSFGILLWEIATLGALPYPEISNKVLFNRVMNGYRMDKPANCSAELYSIMIDCWNQYPTRRPTFGAIRTYLEGLMNDTTKKEYIVMRAFEGDDVGPYQQMETARGNHFGEDCTAVTAEGTSADGDEGVAYFDRLHPEDNPKTRNQYFDHLKTKTKKESGNWKPCFEQLLQCSSEDLSQSPRSENGNGKQYFDHLAERANSSGTAGDSYVDRLTAGESGRVHNSHNGNGNRSLTAAIAGRTLSSLSQNAVEIPSEQVAIGDQPSFRSHRDDDAISICSQDTPM